MRVCPLDDNLAGNLVWASTGDLDSDGVLDKDDFRIDGGNFVPMALRLSENLTSANPSTITITINYVSSVLRVWMPDKDAGTLRSASDIIPSGTAIPIGDLGLKPGDTRVVYVEALDGSLGPSKIVVTATVEGEYWNGTLTDTVHVAPADLSFIDTTAAFNPLNPATDALMVSNYVTTEELPSVANTTFTTMTADEDNFRIQLCDPTVNGSGVNVQVSIWRAGTRVESKDYTLMTENGNTYRGQVLRLVADAVDDEVADPESESGHNDPTILVRLGDLVRVEYRARDGATVVREISVGRPVSENGDKAIREVRLNLISMVRNDENGQPVPYFEGQILDLIERANAAWAQAGVRFVDSAGGPITVDDIRREYDPAGVQLGNGLDEDYLSSQQILTESDEMKALAKLKDNDSKTIDVFFINLFTHSDGTPNEVTRGTAICPLGGPGFQPSDYGTVFLASSPGPFTLPHEIGHILGLSHTTDVGAIHNLMLNQATDEDSAYSPKRLWVGQVELARRNLPR